jgi:hypothetical protein
MASNYEWINPSMRSEPSWSSHFPKPQLWILLSLEPKPSIHEPLGEGTSDSNHNTLLQDSGSTEYPNIASTNILITTTYVITKNFQMFPTPLLLNPHQNHPNAPFTPIQAFPALTFNHSTHYPIPKLLPNFQVSLSCSPVSLCATVTEYLRLDNL